MSLPSNLTFAEMYERFLVEPLFRPFAEQLLERTRPTASDTVLDVACGTGIVARLARKKLGAAAKIVGVDSAPPMIAAARGIDATIDWREGNAAALPVGDGEMFSIVTCHQGLQFVPDKPGAIREMRRVLRSRGRVAIGTWRPLDEVPFAHELDRIAQEYVGPFTDSRHSFGDDKALAALLTDGGFGDVEVGTVSHEVKLADGPLFARMNAMAAVGMSAKGKAMTEAERADMAGRIATASLEAVARFTHDGTLTFALTTNIATART